MGLASCQHSASSPPLLSAQLHPISTWPATSPSNTKVVYFRHDFRGRDAMTITHASHHISLDTSQRGFRGTKMFLFAVPLLGTRLSILLYACIASWSISTTITTFPPTLFERVSRCNDHHYIPPHLPLHLSL